MNIISVIPLVKAKINSDLSYFTRDDIPVGAIVTVPLRSKNIQAIVVNSVLAENIKADIKSANFETKKLGKVKATAFFPVEFIGACQNLAEYYATSVGSIISTLISENILKNSDRIPPPLPIQSSIPIKISSDFNNIKNNSIIAIRGDDQDRLSSWRSLIRQEFARKKSLIFYVPTIEDCDFIFASLEKGIEGYIFKLNSSLSESKVISTWKSIADTDHPVVIIATGSFSVLPRGDIGTVIIERENSKGWHTLKSPYIDIRHALETIAVNRKQILYIADSMLQTETLTRLDNEEIISGSPFKWRSISTANDILVNMKPNMPVNSLASVPHEPLVSNNESRLSSVIDYDSIKFKVVSSELENLIKRNKEENTHLFILTQRRGHSSVTVCGDCEAIVLCDKCSRPVVLHQNENGRNFFMCHICGDRRSADENCKHCNSWKLVPLGIGIDRVFEEIKNKFSDFDIFKVDIDSTKTDKKIEEAIDKFMKKPGSILLGTEIVINRLKEKIDHIAIASFDSLFALPDFRIQEKIMYQLLRLRAQAIRTFLVQTRKIEEDVFEYALKGNISDFYKVTKEEREQYRYPPYSLMIKISVEGQKDKIAKEMFDIQKIFEPKEIDIFPAFTASNRGRSIIHGLIRIPSGSWPDHDLVNKLRSLPPSIKYKINPDSLL